MASERSRSPVRARESSLDRGRFSFCLVCSVSLRGEGRDTCDICWEVDQLRQELVAEGDQLTPEARVRLLRNVRRLRELLAVAPSGREVPCVPRAGSTR